MTDEPFVPFSRRINGQGPLQGVPYEGIPAHLEAPLAEWLLPLLVGPNNVDLAREVAIRLRLQATPQLSHTFTPDYVTAIREYLSQTDDTSLDVLDAVLQLHVGWPSPTSPGHAAWATTVGRLVKLLEDGGSAYEVNVEYHRLEPRLEPSVREAFTAALLLTYQTGYRRAGDRLTNAWREAYGLDPDPSAAVQDSVRAVEAVLIPLVEPTNKRATLGTAIAALTGPGAAKWRLSLRQDRDGLQDSPEPLVGLLRTIWHSHHDRHEGSSPATEVSRETGRAVVHAAALAVQWIATDTLILR